MILARLHAHRWISSALWALALALTGWVTRGTLVDFPLVDGTLPARLVVALGAPVIAVTPLYSSFPEIEPGLVREPWLRGARVLLASTLALAAVLPAWLTGPPDPALHGDGVLFCLLLGAGIGSVIVLGELAWSVPLACGLLSLITDGGREQRLTRMLDRVPLGAAVAVLAVVAMVFVRYGPRRQGR
jgi:hypothetical protein